MSGAPETNADKIPECAANRLAAAEELACLLFWELEKLDSTGHFEMTLGPKENWALVPEMERELYIAGVRRILSERDLIEKALGQRLTKNDSVDWCGRLLGSE